MNCKWIDRRRRSSMSTEERERKRGGNQYKWSTSGSIRGLLRFADVEDVVLMCLGTLGAIGDGCSTNCLLLFASNVMNSIGRRESMSGVFIHEVDMFCLHFVYLGLAVLLVAFFEGYCWSRTSERQVLRLRFRYLEAVLRQEVGFFEAEEAASNSEIISSISDDASKIQLVLGEKMPSFIMHTSMFLSGLGFSAYFSWRLSLAAVPFLLLLVIPGLMYGRYLLRLSCKSHSMYAKANLVVEQALSSVKTVYSLTAEKDVVDRYEAVMDKTVGLGIRQGIAKGLAVGSAGLSFAVWAFLAWYGSRLVVSHGESGGSVYAAGISFVLGGLSLGMALPELKHFAEVSVAARHILEKIERAPLIDGADPNGLTPSEIHGEIEFHHVHFAYPSRPEMPILKDFSLMVPAGTTVALVGGSGSGKSTVMSLLQRFYDPSKGVVMIDGVDVRRLQLRWARERMGLVGQDHALFGTSVKENIMLGNPEATVNEVVAASVSANAHEFIRELPEGYETKIGEKGAFLSGGQKQRIAIARAIVKNPKILLLDEATSALDSESEESVRRSLVQASVGRTTLVVAHKLSTVKDADQIAVMEDGRIVEVGSHDDLIEIDNGHYSRLVKLQREFPSRQSQEATTESLETSPTADNNRGTGSWPIFANKSPASFGSENDREKYHSNTSSHTPPSFSRLLSMNSPEWKQALVGSLAAAIFGSLQPIYAFSIGGMIAAFFVQDHTEMQRIIHRYVLAFISLSATSFVVNVLQHYNFACMGEFLTRRVRLQMLKKMLTFECSWFDEEQNSSSALCSLLSGEASTLKTIVADRVSLLVQTVSGVAIAVTMGLVVAWKLAIVMISFQPVTILCHYGKKIVLAKASLESVESQKRSTQIANESVCNHRMVTSFGCNRAILRLFEEAQGEPKRTAKRKAWVAGATMGLAPCLSFLSWALAFWYGGKLAMVGEVSTADVFKTFFILVSTGKLIAEAGSMTSDLAKGATAVAAVFSVLDRESSLVTCPQDRVDQSPVGRKMERIRGMVQLRRVDFAYPTRPSRLVLHDFTMDVKEGTSMGLVGSSGCGKSTVIGLIQRFYDVDQGSVRIDGRDVRGLDVNWYRSFTALVSQDPVIFSGNIYQNIVMGKPQASLTEVVEAAKAADGHDFISSLNDGYMTDCGERGVQLSGGQKQRIAIARAVIRNPTILVLDEATSALDVRSEQAVQEALGRIMLGRTTIVVAHRLNTVKKLDSIAVIVDGRVAEQGDYSQLMKEKGVFFKLDSLQK